MGDMSTAETADDPLMRNLKTWNSVIRSVVLLSSVGGCLGSTNLHPIKQSPSSLPETRTSALRLSAFRETIWCRIGRVAIMANHSSSDGSGPLAITAMILVLLTSSLAVAAGMRVTLENDMTQAINIRCHSTKSELGPRLVSPGGSYIIDNISSFTSGLKYTCTFEASGKAFTTIDVFVGWGGVKNSPCNCLGDTCPWQITATRFSCNAGAYSRSWG